MLSNLKSGKRLFPLFDFTTGFGAFPARLRTNDQMTVGCLLRSLCLPKTNLRFFDQADPPTYHVPVRHILSIFENRIKGNNMSIINDFKN